MGSNTNDSKLVPLERDLVIALLEGRPKVHTFLAYSSFLVGADLSSVAAVLAVKKHGAWKCSASMRPYGLLYDVVIQNAKGQLICVDIDIDDVRIAYARSVISKLDKVLPGTKASDDFIDYAWRDGLSTDEAVKSLL